MINYYYLQIRRLQETMRHNKMYLYLLLFTLILCGCNTFKKSDCENVIIIGIDSTFFSSHYFINLEDESKNNIWVISKRNILKDSNNKYQEIISLYDSSKRVSVCFEELDGTEKIFLNKGFGEINSIDLEGKIMYKKGKFYNIFKSKNFDGLYYYPEKFK